MFTVEYDRVYEAIEDAREGESIGRKVYIHSIKKRQHHFPADHDHFHTPLSRIRAPVYTL